jgi:hypothetical protein
MIASSGAGLRLEEVVVDDVQANDAERERDEHVLAPESIRHSSDELLTREVLTGRRVR